MRSPGANYTPRTCIFLSLTLLVRLVYALCWVSNSNWCYRSLHMQRIVTRNTIQTNIRQLRSFTCSRIMSFSQSDHDYSMEGLENYAKSLISVNKAITNPTKQTSVCFAIAGGGGHALSTLASTPGASSLLLEGTVLYDRRAIREYVNLPSQVRGFAYSSQEAATMASEAALKRALNFRAQDTKGMTGCVGVGAASSLVSGNPDVQGHGYVVATRSDGARLALNVTLAKSARSRKEEDVFMSHVILRSVELIQEAEKGIKRKHDETNTDSGDSIFEDWSTSVEEDNAVDVAVAAAHRILDDQEMAVILLPIFDDSGKPSGFRALRSPIISNGSLIFPGSFNPPHKGHVSLAQAAIRKAIETGFSFRHNEKPIFFELSITNADKPAIDPETVSERVHNFLELEDLPERWGIILTRAPLFLEKVASLKDCVIDKTDGPIPKICFVVGADTLIRIVNPKYYNGDKDEMVEALRGMKGVHFFGGGRVEQTKSFEEEDESESRFVTGIQELEDLPEDVKDIFTIIAEEEFRVDISSTAIRNQQSEAETMS